MAVNAADIAERAADAAKLPDGFHEKSKIIHVPLDALKVDREYQRDVSMGLVETIRNNYDEVASELVLVSKRQNGDLYIVNGQHRTAAARMLGHKKVWARVVEGLNSAQEAALRLKTNVRLGDRPLERFRAQVAAGDEQSLTIVKLLDRFDTEVNVQPNADTGVNAIASVEALYALDEGWTLNRVFELLRDAYKAITPKHASAANMRGLAWFVHKHDTEADFGRLVELMQGIGILAFDRRARVMQGTMGGSLWLNYYRTYVDLYNEKLRDSQKLEWRTRGSGRLSPQHRGGEERRRLFSTESDQG